MNFKDCVKEKERREVREGDGASLGGRGS